MIQDKKKENSLKRYWKQHIENKMQILFLESLVSLNSLNSSPSQQDFSTWDNLLHRTSQAKGDSQDTRQYPTLARRQLHHLWRQPALAGR